MATEARALARRIVADVFGAPAEAASPEPVAASEAQLVARRIVAEILAERPPPVPVADTAPPVPDAPPASDVPAVPDVPPVPDAAVEPTVVPPDPDPGEQRPPEPSVTGRPEEPPPARAGRWVLVTLAAAIALAVLFPLAIRALLQLLSMS